MKLKKKPGPTGAVEPVKKKGEYFGTDFSRKYYKVVKG
jgi:hypothetical protein